ncbi:hypothetical protein CYMTET_38759 [Cymbomonas tetramitiformis]|uniref:Probable N-acetyltransferase 14 n=1 Tax=Cymbomonas tetramitiformis TaxID=36881 RepID=A0AAE0F4M4_9CHLO|nr:hypothetical protein CYMTET_38759 [Cymbomonas tetramitiformis]|eukprot:gene10961-12961_t
MSITVRDVRTEDNSAVRSLWIEGLRSIAEEHPEMAAKLQSHEHSALAADLSDPAGWYRQNSGHKMWVAEQGGALVGCVAADVRPVTSKEPFEGDPASSEYQARGRCASTARGRLVELSRLAVTEAWRRRGLGRRLVSTVEDWAAQQEDVRRVCAWTNSARAAAFYVGLGYRRENPHSSRRRTRRRYVKMLRHALASSPDSASTGQLRAFVGGLPSHVDAEGLGDLFGAFQIATTSSEVVLNRKGQSKRFGFVTFNNSAALQDALGLHNTVIDGNTISIRPATPAS